MNSQCPVRRSLAIGTAGTVSDSPRREGRRPAGAWRCLRRSRSGIVRRVPQVGLTANEGRRDPWAKASKAELARRPRWVTGPQARREPRRLRGRVGRRKPVSAFQLPDWGIGGIGCGASRRDWRRQRLPAAIRILWSGFGWPLSQTRPATTLNRKRPAAAPDLPVSHPDRNALDMGSKTPKKAP